jgi:hypothetical protein
MNTGLQRGAPHKNAALRKQLVSARLQNQNVWSGGMPHPIAVSHPT